jgi:hypothetical protein
MRDVGETFVQRSTSCAHPACVMYPRWRSSRTCFHHCHFSKTDAPNYASTITITQTPTMSSQKKILLVLTSVSKLLSESAAVPCGFQTGTNRLTLVHTPRWPAIGLVLARIGSPVLRLQGRLCVDRGVSKRWRSSARPGEPAPVPDRPLHGLTGMMAGLCGEIQR